MKILLGLFLYEMMILSHWIRHILLLILTCLFVIHSFGLSKHHTLLQKNGGIEGYWCGGSDAIYNVVHYLTSKRIKNVVLMDNWLWHLVEVMSGWRITEKYLLPDASSLDAETFHLKFNEGLEQELRNKDNVYLFRSPEFAVINCFGLFSQLVQRMNMQVRELKRFRRKDGKILYLIYRVEPRNYI